MISFYKNLSYKLFILLVKIFVTKKTSQKRLAKHKYLVYNLVEKLDNTWGIFMPWRYFNKRGNKFQGFYSCLLKSEMIYYIYYMRIYKEAF